MGPREVMLFQAEPPVREAAVDSPLGAWTQVVGGVRVCGKNRKGRKEGRARGGAGENGLYLGSRCRGKRGWT